MASPSNDPKLKTVEKYHPPYKLNQFSRQFALALGREIIYILATRPAPRLEGNDWEEVFAKCIDAQWTPSNVGLDDVVLKQCAWGAKTVKNNAPFSVKNIRLISGRNSLSYSYGIDGIKTQDPNSIGEMILQIWNERVKDVRSKYAHLRTVVLIKSDNLSEVSVFETNTIMYEIDAYTWQWNERDNLEGIDKKTGIHSFTWQPSGAQFTIIESVPQKRLNLRMKKPPLIDRPHVLEAIGFDETWIEIVKPV